MRHLAGRYWAGFACGFVCGWLACAALIDFIGSAF